MEWHIFQHSWVCFFIYLSKKDKKNNIEQMQWTTYVSQNNTLIALKFGIRKTKQCCESSSERLQWKQITFYASDTFLIRFWHFGVLLCSMRLSKKGSVSKLGLLLSVHAFSLPHCLSFAWSCCVSPETFPGLSHRAQSQKRNLNFPLCWGQPSHPPPKVAQQLVSSSEAAIKCPASAEVAIASKWVSFHL